MEKAIGLIELNSISKGILTMDEMVKAASVEILEAHPVCPGKYIIIISGKVEAVKSSVKHAKETAAENLVDELIIPNIHHDVFFALTATSNITELKALGIIETFTAASAIIAGDSAVKSSSVKLIEIRLSNGMGGKSFLTLTGDIGSVNSAIDTALDILKDEGVIVGTSVIASPHKEISKFIL